MVVLGGIDPKVQNLSPCHARSDILSAGPGRHNETKTESTTVCYLVIYSPRNPDTLRLPRSISMIAIGAST